MPRFFNPNAPLTIARRKKLPHWSQPGTLCFITWRTLDSMPKAVLDSWRADRDQWLRRHGIDAEGDVDWKLQLEMLPPREIRLFHATFTARWHGALDAGHGACLLRRPELSMIVADSLMHFDGDRYALDDFVVMPNHVHLLAAFISVGAMLDQCESWKHFTAMEINKATGGKGRFWQQDAFDHLVRSELQWERLKRYIAENPVKAGLKPGEYRLK